MPNIIHQPNNPVKGSDLKIFFLGTPEFALPALEKLINSEFKPVAVFCAPDKPVGRKQILTPPPTKILAQKYNIPVFQPANSYELADIIKSVSVDLIICVAYGLLLPKEVLDAPKFGCLNLHPSLLPKYRGASPLQATILNGDQETGVTIFKIEEKMDTGPIAAKQEWQINNQKLTTPELSKKLAEVGANLLLKILPDWLTGKITPTPQDDSLASYTKIIKREAGKIDWQKSAKEIEQQIRAFTPWPGTYATLPSYSPNEVKGSKIKIIKAESPDKQLYLEQSRRAGKIFLTDDKNLAVQTSNGCLIINELQPEGGKTMSASDFLRGHKNIIGTILT